MSEREVDFILAMCVVGSVCAGVLTRRILSAIRARIRQSEVDEQDAVRVARYRRALRPQR